MLLRCLGCGHAAPYREGARFCAACAAPLPCVPCAGCSKENFTGDRFCAFCARPLPNAFPAFGSAATPAGERGVESPVGEVQELLAMAADARLRADAAANAPPPMTKRHLGQDDIDSLFGQGETP
jgi:hypothetical protein